MQDRRYRDRTKDLVICIRTCSSIDQQYSLMNYCNDNNVVIWICDDRIRRFTFHYFDTLPKSSGIIPPAVVRVYGYLLTIE